MPKAKNQDSSMPKKMASLVLAELVIAVIVVYLFYKLFGINLDVPSHSIAMAPNPDPVLLFFLVLSAALLAVLYFAIKKKQPGLFSAHSLAKATIKDKAVEKARLAKEDPRAVALLLIDFAFVAAVAITAFAWIDPEYSVIPWELAGIFEPWRTVLNAAIAIAVLAFFYYLHTFTAWYRK